MEIYFVTRYWREWYKNVRNIPSFDQWYTIIMNKRKSSLYILLSWVIFCSQLYVKNSFV
jgi:hypothetical protein